MVRPIPKAKIIKAFDSVPPNLKSMLSLTRNKSATTVIEKILRNKNPMIGLGGLGKPVNLKGLEIGCENLDAAKAAALAGVRTYDVNSAEFVTLVLASRYIRKAKLDVEELVGDIQNVFFTKDYDFFIACRMGRYFNRMKLQTFPRLIHGNTVNRRPKRIYFFDVLMDHKENLSFFGGLENRGFNLIEIKFPSKWYGVVAEMEAIPGKVKIEMPKGPQFMTFEQFRRI